MRCYAMRLKIIHTLLFPPLLIANSYLLAADFYVAPTGQDGASGSKSDPWSLNYANSQLQPGDVAILRGGTYKDKTIAPARSGTSEQNRIIYIAYSGETPEFRASTKSSSPINIENRNYITIDGISADGEGIYQDSKYEYWGYFNNTSNCTLKNSTFIRSEGYSALLFKNSSKYNKVLNNSFDYNGAWDVYKWKGTHEDSGSSMAIRAGNKFNLIQGNIFRRSGHDLGIIQGDYNIIRDNTYDNTWEIYSGTSFSYKSGNIESGDPVGNRAVSLKAGFGNIFEQNIIKNIPESVDDSSVGMIKVNGKNQIVRNNYFFNGVGDAMTSSVGSSSPDVYNNRIYHNTFYNIKGAAWSTISYGAEYPAPRKNIFKNNIFYKVALNKKLFVIINNFLEHYNDPFLDTVFSYNCVAIDETASNQMVKSETLGSKPLSNYEDSYPVHFSNNIQQDPKFINENPSTISDFKLSSSSPCLGTSGELTTTLQSGSGTILTVADASYFTDGYGVIEGDLINIGSETVRINNIDLSTNKIIIDRSISWSKGDPVNLAFTGTRPNIGALSFEVSETPPPDAPKNVRIKVI